MKRLLVGLWFCSPAVVMAQQAGTPEKVSPAAPGPSFAPSPGEKPGDKTGEETVPPSATAPAPAPASPSPTPAATNPLPPAPGGDKPKDMGTGVPLFGGQGEIAKPGPGPFLSDFMDTRVTFGLTDDDFLADSGRTTPSSPRPDFQIRPGNETFFNNIDRRDTLRETLSHLVVHRRLPGYFWGVDTEAAMVARFSMFSDPDNGRLGQAFRDDGSYLRAAFFPFGDTSDKDNVNFEAVFFPFNTVRYRLGYLWDITWGGPEVFPSRNVAAPGMKLQVNYNKFRWVGGYAYVGAKTARMLDERINEIQANWGGLAGAGLDIAKMVSWEFGTGIFQRGTNPLTGVKGEPVLGYGGSTRLLLHLNTPNVQGLDFRLMRNDLGAANFFLQNRAYNADWSFTLAWEFTWLQHTLQDADNLTSTLRQNARATALSARLRLWYFQFSADAIVRDLAFVLYNRPGFVPFQAFPGDNQRNILGMAPGECPFQVEFGGCKVSLASKVQPELMLVTGISAYIPVARLTPAVIFGIQKPATFQGYLPTAVANNGVPDQTGSQTVVVRNNASVDVLPCAEYDPNVGPSGERTCLQPSRVTPIFTTRVAIKWDLSDLLSVVGEQVITVDRNRTEIIDDVEGQGTTRRAFYEADAPAVLRSLGAPSLPMRWGGGMYVQARF